ncbi:sigma factor-like helix-turn-helix DNA-binding protein [Butyribacter sp.]|uniref:sigma factor-like helix-turn-helix DNA-binding protein n=1 Tax=Butyribacter sp. TaxID=2822465 RepID=UPI002A9AB58F|nr:sigma factor-like helix-turn-helix DNA-binding protein [Lachnoclostridium sp.]MDY5180155.1 sigma factor-like helix-turn-helix DNA-binding protein [Butyribacter sp.]
MRIKMRYEDAYQTLEVETQEVEKWLNVSISEDENEEDYEKRIQKEIEVRYNRPEYNNWHKFDRHRGNLKKQFRKDDEETDESDGLDTVGDYSQEEERNNKYEYEALCQELRTVLKPEYAEVIIAVCLDELTPEEYAATTGEKRDTVYKRLQRAKKKIQEIF